jgi:hypothetical protein
MQEADIVYQRPAHPLKYFLATQKALFFLVCFFTICISIYLKSHFHFNPEYVLGAVVLFKILSLVMQTKKRQLQGYEDRNLAMAFQDDFQAFVNSWKTNMIIEIVTLSAGVIILSLDMLKV